MLDGANPFQQQFSHQQHLHQAHLALQQHEGPLESLQSALQSSFQQCCIPTGECLRADALVRPSVLHECVKVVCNNEACPAGQFMHRECFDAWEASVLTYLKSCGRARSWSERQRHQNLWTKKGYDLAFKACGCKCGRGHLKKDLDWVPPGQRSDDSNGSSGPGCGVADGKKKKRRNRQNSGNGTTVGGVPRPLQVGTGAHHQPIDVGRGRAGSLSSSTGSSSPPATSETSVSPLHQPQALVKRKSKVDFFGDRIRWVFKS